MQREGEISRREAIFVAKNIRRLLVPQRFQRESRGVLVFSRPPLIFVHKKRVTNSFFVVGGGGVFGYFGIWFKVEGP